MKLIRRAFNFLAVYGWTTTLIVLAVFALGFTWSSSDKLYSNIRLFDRIALMTSQKYVDDIDEEKMIMAGVDAMLSKLDKYTKFLRDSDYLSLMQETDGQFEGVGIGMEFHRDTLTIVSVIKNTPAFRMGLKPGYRVLKIGSTSTFGLGIKEIRALMRGDGGNDISLLIISPGKKERWVDVPREKVTIDPIPYYSMISDNIGYILLAHFSENSFMEFKSAVIDLKKSGMQSLILDLRDNPGGLLLEAVEIAGIFLPVNSKIVETRGRDGALISSYESYNDPIFPDGGLAVIVDEQTASAAEIVAGALQDNDRGIIIGTDTYGKGLVQQIMQFSDESALKITTSKYYLPSGRCLQKPGWSTFELLSDRPSRPTDSLYFTNAGRVVFGGGGIIPDIFIENNAESRYVAALKEEACFFDFAVDYLSNLDPDTDPIIDDDIMREFKKFVAGRGFAFYEEDRVIFNEFKEKVKLTDTETMDALAIIDAKLNSKELWYFDNNYKEIKTALTEEIVYQAKGEKTLFDEIWVKNDDEIKIAKETLRDNRKYLSILASR